MNITDRDEVGRLWLPWCVERTRPEVPLRIERDPDRRDAARQLRVSDLSEESAQVALANYPRDEQTASVWSSINYWAGVFSEMVGRRVLDDAKLFETPEGLMLHEGSHRTCGLYVSGITDFEIRVAAVEPLGWQAYNSADLRLVE